MNEPKVSVESLHEVLHQSSGVFYGQSNCDEVYPGIILGDHQLSRHPAHLPLYNVTHVLNTAHGEVRGSPELYDPYHIRYMGIEALDVPSYDLKAWFIKACDFIHGALESGGKINIHCRQGISRSASLVIAYLMLYCHRTVHSAITLIRKKRYIYPNEGFLQQLCQLQSDIDSKKSAVSLAVPGL